MNVHEGLVTIQRLRFSELTLHSSSDLGELLYGSRGTCGELSRKQLVYVLL